MIKYNCFSFVIIGITIFLCSCGTDSVSKKNHSSAMGTDFEFEKSATVSGTLEKLGYENLAGTKMETYILVLDKSINVASKNPDILSQKNIKEIQVGFSDSETSIAALLNKNVTLKGDLYPEQTVNDRRPVVMINATVTK